LLLALSASGLIPGENVVKCLPFLLLTASRGRKAYPRKVKVRVQSPGLMGANRSVAGVLAEVS
jgi:hypothetical protein